MYRFAENIILLLFPLFFSGCITRFVPETIEIKDLLAVEGLITDQPQTYYVYLSISQPLGQTYIKESLGGCLVSVSDDHNQVFNFNEISTGTYISDSTVFQGITGRSYTLHIVTNESFNNLEFESIPMELKAVPAIDSLYYEKVTIREATVSSQKDEGCQIYINTHDPENNCRFYRWTYSEAWEFWLPYDVPNNRCWFYDSSDRIYVKSTKILSEDKIYRYPIKFISDKTDRLKEKYSILVTQYSLNEDEFNYWEKLQNISDNVGGLYDFIPSNVHSNIFCLDIPDYEAMGYFSVSAVTSKRIFIKDVFLGINNLYALCPEDTIYPPERIVGLGLFTWIIIEGEGYKVITSDLGCYDCTVRGTNVEPLFWHDNEK